MNADTYTKLAFSLLCLLLGFVLLWLGGRANTKRTTLINLFSCLLIALGVVVAIFTIFENSAASGSILGFNLGGAFAALIVLFVLVTRMAGKAEKLDDVKDLVQQRDAEIKRLNNEARRPKPFGECNTHAYALKNAPGKKLALVTGDIMNIECADIWVSSENTNMEMARFFDRSVSASIRYYGATRDPAGDVTDDVIADQLKAVKGDKFYVQPTSLFVTGPGQLSDNGVKKIFHVAAVHGAKPQGYQPVEDLESCVRKSLKEAERYKDEGYTSILFPLLATGTARGDLKPISARLLETAITYLEKHPESTIKTIYFLTWSDIDLETCQAILEQKEFADRVNLVS
jgi:O-acetyl-ADP-ribose deacetylase (regulator of RNase III)